MAEKKNVLAQEFERLQGKVGSLFRPLYDPIDEMFFELIGKFQKAGVDFLEVNHTRKTAIAKHSNYYEYPERRYAVTVNDKNKVKFYELQYANSDVDSAAKEISQKEFEELAIPSYLKANPLMSKEDQKEDREPKEVELPGGSKPTAKAKDMTLKKTDAINAEKPKDHPEISKKTVESGDTLAPKGKLYKKLEEATDKPINVDGTNVVNPTETQGYTGTVGNVGPLEAKKKIPLDGYELINVTDLGSAGNDAIIVVIMKGSEKWEGQLDKVEPEL